MADDLRAFAWFLAVGIVEESGNDAALLREGCSAAEQDESGLLLVILLMATYPRCTAARDDIVTTVDSRSVGNSAEQYFPQMPNIIVAVLLYLYT